MSRGLGKEQRRVLQVLTEVAEEHGDAWVLLRSLAGQDPTWIDGEPTRADKSRWESTRRAVRTLVRRGLVEKSSTAHDGIIHSSIVRLRPVIPRTDLPLEVDYKVGFHLKQLDDIHNYLLRKFGSRHRKITVSRPSLEPDRLWIQSEPDGQYDVIYLYPSETSSSEDWQLRQAELIAAADRESEDAIEAEVRRRVAVELGRREPVACPNCGARSEQPVQDPVEPETMHDLYLAMADSVGLEIRNILVGEPKPTRVRHDD